MYFFAGRFQPFHNVHLELVERLISFTSPEIVIGIATKKMSFDNPFTFIERQIMIQKALVTRDINMGLVRFVPLFIPRALDWEINDSFFPSNKIWCISSKEKQRIENYRILGEKVLEIESNSKNVSATIIRKKIVDGEPWEELVPETVAKYIHQIDGCNRIIELYENAIFCNEPVAGLFTNKRK
jgi:nicotinamide-nucleotide adenylyltransferase